MPIGVEIIIPANIKTTDTTELLSYVAIALSTVTVIAKVRLCINTVIISILTKVFNLHFLLSVKNIICGGSMAVSNKFHNGIISFEIIYNELTVFNDVRYK